MGVLFDFYRAIAINVDSVSQVVEREVCVGNVWVIDCVEQDVKRVRIDSVGEWREVGWFGIFAFSHLHYYF